MTSEVRNAATVILCRERESGAEILMGQRGSAAAFMPNRFVFPGGAVDSDDVALADLLKDRFQPDPRLLLHSDGDLAAALPLAGLRELWEETGLAPKGDSERNIDMVPDGWRGYFSQFGAPPSDGLRFFFRAITPPGRPRRFDARFFVASADAFECDLEDFSCASGELSHLRWVDIAAARALPLPFITEVVLAELEAVFAGDDRGDGVPFFDQTAQGPVFRML